MAPTDQLSGRVGHLTQLLGQMAGALGVAFTFRELVTSAAQMEQLRSGLVAVTGDATKAGQELEFVRKVASRIGADVTEVGRAFLGLSAATRGTAVEGEPTRQVFEAVATAMGKAGKSSAETTNALQALSQMASKGVVQSEELRGQLGEALPGALNAAAKGMGITTQELMKLVEEGKIAASDLFPALTKGLNDLYGGASSAQTLTQELVNIKNAAADLAANVGEAGGLSALKTGAEIAQAAIVGLDATIVAVGKSIGTVIAAVVSRDFSGLKQAFADIEKEAQDKILKAAQHNETLRNSLKASGDQAVIAALAQQELATKTGAAGAAAAAGASDFVKLQNGYLLIENALREQIAAQEKSVAARDAEAKAAEGLANAFGTENEQRAAHAAATAVSAIETEKLTALKLTELATMQAELQVKLKEAEIAEVTAKKMSDLADAHRMAGNEASRSVGGYRAFSQALGEQEEAMDRIMMKYKLSADYSERQIALLEREAAAAERAAEAYRKKWNIDKDGFTLDANGNRMQQSLPTGNYVYETAKSQGLDEATALQLMDKFFRNGQGVGTEKGTDWFSTVNKAIADMVIEEARKRAAQGPAQASTADPAMNPQPAGTRSGVAAATYVTNITIPGVGQGTTRHADEQSARTEVDLLRRLAMAKGVSQ